MRGTKIINYNNGGIGFCSALALLFIAFKLLHIINWSWLWVLAPIWIPSAIAVAVLIIVGLIYLFLAFK